MNDPETRMTLIEFLIFADDLLNQSGGNKWHLLYPTNPVGMPANRFLRESKTILKEIYTNLSDNVFTHKSEVIHNG